MAAAAAVIAIASVAPAAAAPPRPAKPPKPQVVDPVGDAVGAQPGTDIHSVLFESTRTGRTTTHLRVTMTLGARAHAEPGVLYRISADHDECGTFEISWSPGALIRYNQVYMGCGTESAVAGQPPYTIHNLSPRYDGHKLVWTFRLTHLPKPMRSGELSRLTAFVGLTDPVTGIVSPTEFVEAAGFDAASGNDATFRY